MDWDDIRKSPSTSQPVQVGEPLESHSVEELKHRISVLEGEIERVRRELNAKIDHEARAAAIFKS